MLLIYALAVLALNILTGGSGQFSLGQSAFYAVGAYTSAILMEHVGMNYALTLPVAGMICFVFGFLFGQPALRLERRLSGAGDVRAGDRDAAAPQARLLRALDRRRAGHRRDQARCAVRPADVAGQVALLLHARDHDRDLYRLGQPAADRARAAPSWRSATTRSRPPPWASTSRCTRRWPSASAPASPVSPAALGAIAVQFVAPDSYTITLAISLFLGMVVGGVGWLPGSIVGSRLHHLRAQHRRGHFQGPLRARCSASCCSSSST